MLNRQWSVLLGLALSSVVVAQSSDVKREIQGLYDKAGNLLIQQDLKGAVKFLQDTRTPGYTYIFKSSRHTNSDLLKSMAVVLSTYRVTKSSVRIKKFKNTNDTATVAITSIIGLETKPTKAHARHMVEQEVHSEDSWVKIGSQWKLKLSRVVAENITQDGQLMKQ